MVGVVGDPGDSVTNLFSSAKYKNKLERLSSAGFFRLLCGFRVYTHNWAVHGILHG